MTHAMSTSGTITSDLIYRRQGRGFSHTFEGYIFSRAYYFIDSRKDRTVICGIIRCMLQYSQEPFPK